jgi:uncharacterized protein (DUF1684 family)
MHGSTQDFKTAARCIKGADLGMDAWGRAILDFNFAYNPSCAYSARWICPLAPPANALARAITAGERMPA